jgi:hypothetical protein
MKYRFSKAVTLWIEAGAMSGGSRNQLELPDWLANFFDRQARRRHRFAVRLPNGKLRNGQLAHRGRLYGQWTDIWRLGLPTHAKGAPRYPDSVVRIDRVGTGKKRVYELSVAPPGSRVAREWKHHARRAGWTGSTGGHQGRRAGCW